METEPSTLFLSILFLAMAKGRPIRRRFAFDPSRRSCFAVSNAVSLQTANSMTNQARTRRRTNLFWAISESGVVSFAQFEREIIGERIRDKWLPNVGAANGPVAIRSGGRSTNCGPRMQAPEDVDRH